jgi:hypothetical protein
VLPRRLHLPPLEEFEKNHTHGDSFSNDASHNYKQNQTKKKKINNNKKTKENKKKKKGPSYSQVCKIGACRLSASVSGYIKYAIFFFQFRKVHSLVAIVRNFNITTYPNTPFIHASTKFR